MDVDKILPFSSTLGWHSIHVNGEVQTRKGLRWIPRHPETRKGVASDEMLRGVENQHRSGDSRIVPRGKESKSDSRSSGERNGSSLNRENGVVGEQYKRRAARRSGGVLHPRWRESSSRKHTSLRSDPSSMGHVESRVNQQGPPCKAKYFWVTDSEVVP
ncbi:hypothetical protein HPP92_028428 [Vanilla planifolia]|uniref:Uncharacterized protein n=1 Tax=Vanilla planifolia TaxID=51239 RepID=A0A835P886_VANPL|nr:hypothetical protein HPP92_028428 [Vanilla planifolia]KAG0447293.1 hypothetical protein HPP92_028396 [Vanilla planifolia]KAG0447301.1 hypothetical protein HPP92_028404 [Vanilla planifolia]KAG0447310.1 hypothetical protein HPP92_028413 [Vanilla planifolia]KAG0447318.1 hypothetical protein HPP92_028421 [Vanilla planifolia]